MIEEYRRICLIASAIMIAQTILILRLMERSIYAPHQREFKIYDFQKYREAAQRRAQPETSGSDCVSCSGQNTQEKTPPDIAG